MALAFQRKVENEIDGKFSAFEQTNESKRIEFIVSIWSSFFWYWNCHVYYFYLWIEHFMEFQLQNRANAHNDGISNEIIAKFENRVLNGIGGNYLSDDNFYNLFMSSKTTALDEVYVVIINLAYLFFHLVFSYRQCIFFSRTSLLHGKWVTINFPMTFEFDLNVIWICYNPNWSKQMKQINHRRRHLEKNRETAGWKLLYRQQ